MALFVQQQQDDSLLEFPNLPNTIKNWNGQTVLGVRTMSKTKRLALHLYEVVIPELGEWEALGELYIDKTNKIATYRTVATAKPTLEEAAVLKRKELASIERQMRGKIAENSIDAVLEGSDTTAAKTLLVTLRAAKQATLDKIQGYVDTDDLDALLGYELNSPQTAALLAAIENLKA